MKLFLIFLSALFLSISAQAQNIKMLGMTYAQIVDYQKSVSGTTTPLTFDDGKSIQLKYEVTKKDSTGETYYTYMIGKESKVCECIIAAYKGVFESTLKPYLNQNFKKYSDIQWLDSSGDVQVIAFDYPEKKFFTLAYTYTTKK